jgi:hypothetical protein
VQRHTAAGCIGGECAIYSGNAYRIESTAVFDLVPDSFDPARGTILKALAEE